MFSTPCRYRRRVSMVDCSARHLGLITHHVYQVLGLQWPVDTAVDCSNSSDACHHAACALIRIARNVLRTVLQGIFRVVLHLSIGPPSLGFNEERSTIARIL